MQDAVINRYKYECGSKKICIFFKKREKDILERLYAERKVLYKNMVFLIYEAKFFVMQMGEMKNKITGR